MATTQPDETLNTMESHKPYQLRMAWFNSSNFLAPTCSAQPKRWHDALCETIEFCVIQDLFLTPTAMAVGDYFLPMSTWAEHDGICPHPLWPQHRLHGPDEQGSADWRVHV